jgi:3-oxoacyl-[acyl-carrier-protein] synthase II
MNGDRARVFVTGMGVISPLGNDIESSWKNLIEGRSGAGPITRFDASDYETRFACEVKDFSLEGILDRKDAKRMDRFVQFASRPRIRPSRPQAWRMLPPTPSASASSSAGIGGMETFEEQHTNLLEKGHRRVSPFFIPMMISDMAAGQVSITFGLKGPNFGTVSACASGAHAIGEALRLLRAGDADVILCGGAKPPSRPWRWPASATCGLSPHETTIPSARAVRSILDGTASSSAKGPACSCSRRRPTRVRVALADLRAAGYGASGDAYHMTAPCVDGEGAARAMKRALADSGTPADEVGYINAHGTSTPAGDPIEVTAVKAIFASRTPPDDGVHQVHDRAPARRCAAASRPWSCALVLQRGSSHLPSISKHRIPNATSI